MINSRNVFLFFSFGLICCGAIFQSRPVGARVSESDFVSMPLVATKYNAGNVGKATLMPQGDKTVVRVALSGVPDYTSRPIHIYTYIYDGTCGSRNATPRFALTDRVLADGLIAEPGLGPEPIGVFTGPVQLAHSIPMDFQAFRATRYAISVRTSPADGNTEIFCGDNSH